MNLETVLLKGLKKTRIAMWIMTPIFLVIPGIVWLAAPAPEDNWSWVAAIGITALFGSLAAFFGFLSMKDPTKAPILQILRERPHDIVWVYARRNHHNGAHVGTALVLGTAQGKRHTAGIPIPDEEALILEVRQRAPAARLGFSKELEAQFKTDPASLRT